MPNIYHFVLHNNHTESCVLKRYVNLKTLNATSFYTFICFHYSDNKYKSR